VQTEFVAVVHVRAELQFATGVHCEQRSSACDSSSHVPVTHVVHCEVVGDWQVSGEDTQPLMPVQGTHADLSAFKKYPAAHCSHCDALPFTHVSGEAQWAIGVQASHVSGDPSLSQKPLLHDSHCESVGEWHVVRDVQFGTGLQSTQTDPPFACGATKNPASHATQYESSAVLQVI
jgi:hypothetical protein